MKFSILHLSDLHFKEKEHENPILQRSTILFDIVKNEFLESEIIFLVVTGDIAFSGRKEEYNQAKKFFIQLKQSIEAYSKKDCEIILIPGNHDCLFEKNSIRDAVIKSLESDGFSGLDDKLIEICCDPQKHFYEFQSDIQSKNLHIVYQHKLIQIIEYSRDGQNLIFNCFNTSWISKLHEEPGRMVYPSSFIDDNIYNNVATVAFNLIHHPINWQSPIASREFRKTLEKTGDIILSGHEHEKDEQLKYSLDGKFTGYIEGPALQDSTNKNKSGLSIIKFHIKKDIGEYLISRFALNTDISGYHRLTDPPIVTFKARSGGTSGPFLDASFAKELENPGAQFIHSEVDKIYLSDIMVYPDLKLISAGFDRMEGSNVIMNSETIFTTPSQGKEKIRKVIVGGDYSGKSTLCKRLYSFYQEKGLIPILLKGHDLKEINKDKFRNNLKAQFLKQYDKRYSDKFDSIDNKKLVLIVDDFQTCPIKNQYRIQLLERLKEVYDHIIFTGSAIVQFEPFITSKHERIDVFADFDSSLILELGIEARAKLINKWIRLGREAYVERNELLRKIDSAEKLINSVLGKGFIPAYPIFLLTLLQSIESGNSNPEYSLYGHYYEFLINESIIKNIKDKGYHQFYHQFLTEYCYFLFDNKLRELDKNDFEKFAVKYQTAYETKIYFELIFDNLVKAKFLRDREGSISISYKYIYYYYVAKYFADNIADGIIRQMISKMAKRLHREEFSNILMFLTHLSKDPIVLTEIHSNADNLLKDLPVSKLEQDIDFINLMIDEIPKLVLEGNDVDKLRDEDIKDKDEYERIEREFEANRNLDIYDLDEDLSAIDIINTFIMSLKSFELLGQITKKYWGSIKGDKKLEYSESTFNLALRTMNFYFKCISENKEGVVDWVKILVDKKKIKDSLEIKEFTKKFIFHLSYVAAFSIIKRVSNAVGHVELGPTFDALLTRNPYNSYKLIDLSIKLDFFDQFPHKHIEQLLEDKMIKKNYLAKYIVQNLVYNYLRLYEVSPQNRQRIANLVNIDIKDQLATYHSSPLKKGE